MENLLINVSAVVNSPILGTIILSPSVSFTPKKVYDYGTEHIVVNEQK